MTTALVTDVSRMMAASPNPLIARPRTVLLAAPGRSQSPAAPLAPVPSSSMSGGPGDAGPVKPEGGGAGVPGPALTPAVDKRLPGDERQRGGWRKRLLTANRPDRELDDVGPRVVVGVLDRLAQ